MTIGNKMMILLVVLTTLTIAGIILPTLLPPPMPSSNSVTAHRLETFGIALMQYVDDYKSLPKGAPDEYAFFLAYPNKSTSGNARPYMEFDMTDKSSAYSKPFDAQRRFLDAWGNPIQISILNGSIVVYSFGMNQKDDKMLADDIVWKK